MKAQTKIATAVKLYRDAVSDYMRIVYNVPNIPKIPDVRWHAGTGWTVDDKREHGDSAAIVNKYGELSKQCFEAIKDFQGRPLKTSRKPKRESAIKPDERSGASQERLDEAERQP